MKNQYRKKPVVIEAVQLVKNIDSITECLRFICYIKDTDHKHGNDLIYNHADDIAKEGIGIRLKTPESDNETQIASFGDYIIKGVNGEFYPCKPDIFEKTYEIADSKVFRITDEDLKPFLYWIFHTADKIYVETQLGWRENAIEEMFLTYKKGIKTAPLNKTNPQKQD